jgi:hypothetical protein
VVSARRYPADNHGEWTHGYARRPLKMPWCSSTNDPPKYILDEDGQPKLINVELDDGREWDRWFVNDERRFVRSQTFTLANGVPTRFLGYDYSLGKGPPVLWETLGGRKHDHPVLGQEFWRRYTSLEAAIAGHNEIVAEIGGPVLEDSILGEWDEEAPGAA